MVKFTNPFDGSKLKLLVFDLDGTLVDSRIDLVQSVNAMLEHFHRPRLPGEVIASYVGDGAPMLVRRALGDPDEEVVVEEAVEYFLAYYRVHKLDHTQVYPGVREALEAIRDHHGSDRRMAVLSNKPVNPSRAIIDALGLGEFFIRVYGGNSFHTKKPDPLGIETLLGETGMQSDQAIMIGDSSIDVITGRNAELWTCGVTYGFAPRTLDDAPPDVLIDAPADLVELFAHNAG
ncbi:MAG: HAD-IA family hydrolase [Acidobacteria bacterium]|nr:HAD-IA family hydrolase [Acidobacteriota bacterium]